MKIKLLILLLISTNIYSQIIEEGKGYNSINIGLKSTQIIKLLGKEYEEIIDEDEFIYNYSKSKNIGVSFNKDSIAYSIAILPSINKLTSKGLLIKNGLTRKEIEEVYRYRDWTLSETEVLGYDIGIVFHMKNGILDWVEIEEKDEDYIDNSIQEYINDIYIPKNIDECLTELNKIVTEKDKKSICSMSENEFIGNSHFGIGLYIRNSWGLWANSRLVLYFNGIGIYHPDDMSGIVLTSYYRKLKGKKVKLEKQINHYKKYWKKAKKNKK